MNCDPGFSDAASLRGLLLGEGHDDSRRIEIFSEQAKCSLDGMSDLIARHFASAAQKQL